MVLLPDGRQVSSYSEAWRRHCEARWALSLPDHHRIKAKLTKRRYLEQVRESRGKQAAEILRAEMLKQYKTK